MRRGPQGRTSIERKTIQLSRISYINRQINSSMPLPELLTAILASARELVRSMGASLLLAEPGTGDLTFAIVLGDKKEVIKGRTVPRGRGIAGIVADTKKPLIVNDAQNNPAFFKGIDNESNFVTENILCVPMVVRDRLVGVLEAVNTIGRAGFDTCDRELLSYLADQAATAISSRELFDELTSRIEELTALYEISQAITFAKSDSDILNSIMRSIAQSLNVDRASLILHDLARNRLVLRGGFGLPDSLHAGMEVPLGATVAGRVFATGIPLLVNDRRRDLPDIPADPERRYRTESFISVPVHDKNAIAGVLSIADRKDSGIFDAFNLSVVSTVANHLSEVYQNIEYQKQADAQKKLAQEIEIAAEIQRKILPVLPDEFLTHRLAALNRPAKEVGGDFYDFFKFDENKYAVLVGDVSGKGIPAALFTGAARNIIRAEMRIHSQPATLLRHANRYIFEDSESGMFVTLFYMLIDARSHTITYGSAGHNDQLFIQNNPRKAIMLNSQGRPLGIEEESSFEERMLVYEPGDMILLFTDGVLEHLGNGDIDAGETRLIELSFEYLKRNPAEYIRYFHDMLSNNAVDNDFIDDFTVLSVKF